MNVGIIGAGQLGMMLGEAAQELGISCRFLDPSENPPAAGCGDIIQAAYDDADALAALAEWADVVTYEFENVPVAALSHLGNTPVFPPAPALATAQDRLSEKQLFDQLSIPLPGYHPVDSLEDLKAAIERLAFPVVLKTRRLGYDGKGQFVVRDDNDLQRAWHVLGGPALIAEAWVSFDYEVSAIATRAADGSIAHFPLTRNAHVSGILDTSVAPEPDDELAALARDYVTRLLQNFDYVGTVALELFVCGDRLLANEFAPRVHNSGHWTIEGTACSQFENHLRAVAGLPLGDPEPARYSAMKNLIGTLPAGIRDISFLHDYGKTERAGRKLGHITLVRDTAEERDKALNSLNRRLTT